MRFTRPSGVACALHADVSNRFQVANMIEQARDAFGGIDILVNAVAILHAEPLLHVDEWSWRRQIEVNITGTFFSTQLVARVMADEGGGSVINLASRRRPATLHRCQRESAMSPAARVSSA